MENKKVQTFVPIYMPCRPYKLHGTHNKVTNSDKTKNDKAWAKKKNPTKELLRPPVVEVSG